MERHHAELSKRADRMHQLLRLLREAEGDPDAPEPAPAAGKRARKVKSA